MTPAEAHRKATKALALYETATSHFETSRCIIGAGKQMPPAVLVTLRGPTRKE